VPWKLRQPLAHLLLRLSVGPPERCGLPKPERGVFEGHPTISDTIVSRIAHGAIAPRPGIERLEGDRVRFTDGRVDEVDAIVWCTGYRVELPFLDRGLTGERPDELHAYKRILHLEAEDLFFVGLMQSTGSAFPILERQSRLLADHLAGRWSPPSAADMRADCERRRRAALRRWGPHGRPAMRVDFDRYMHELAQEIDQGHQRAGAAA